MAEKFKQEHSGQGEPRLSERPCPVCAAQLTATNVAEAEQAVPKPGDVTLCVFCATPLIFGPGLELRVMSDAEVDALEGEEGARYRDALNVVREFKGRNAH